MIIVVWGPGAAAPNYFQAVANTRVVAKQIKMVIDMITKRGALLKKIHLIGHSLGAHTSGHVGYLLKPENKTIGRITGINLISYRPSHNQMHFLYQQLVICSCDTGNNVQILYFCFREV